MKIAGLDLSLTGTAICGVTEDLQVVNQVMLTTKATTPMHLRLRSLVADIICECVEFEMVFIEGFSFMSKGRAVVDIAGLGWLVRQAFFTRGIPYFEVPPSTLKMFITGKGNSKKEVMLEQVYRKYGIGSETLKNNDAVDAFALGVFGHYFVSWLKKQVDGLTAVQEKAFKKMPKNPTCRPSAWPSGLPRHPEASPPTP